MGATIIDVAMRCGYSKATVARAYATPESVSDKAKEKIYAAARELNYAPNAIARAMVRQRTENISFVIHEKQYPAILNPFYSIVLEAAMQEGAKRNYSLFVTANHDMHLPNGEAYIKKQMDGVIFAGETDPEIIKQFRVLGIPVVLLNKFFDMEGLLCVTADHFSGAAAATAHLYERGHHRIGFLAGRFSEQVSKARYDGYLHVLRQHGLPLEPQYVVDIDPTLEDGQQAAEKLLQLPIPPTAFFCTNDTIAAGAMKAVLRAGLRIPEDIAVVGFDDSYISRVVEPGLTTVRIDGERMGRIAAQKLFDLIEGNPIEERNIQISTELIIRKSS